MMNSYIPKQPKQSRERLEVKIDSRLARKLESYCEYLESERDYVVAQVLELAFRKDKGFIEWLHSRERLADAEVPDVGSTSPVQHEGREPLG